MPQDRRTIIDGSVDWTSVDRQTRSYVGEAVNQGRSEPLAHEMFREAWHEHRRNPRSALVLGMSAAEVGFKQLVADLVPDADWLAFKAPSPPLFQMLKEYLPSLPVKLTVDGKAVVPTEVLKAINKGIELRNKVVHSRSLPPTATELTSILSAVRDVIWLLDYYGGNKWALEYVRRSTKRALGVH